MDLARSVYSRDLKIVAMRALDAGSTTSEIARKYQLSPKLLERWRGEWRAKAQTRIQQAGTGQRQSAYRQEQHRAAAWNSICNRYPFVLGHPFYPVYRLDCIRRSRQRSILQLGHDDPTVR